MLAYAEKQAKAAASLAEAASLHALEVEKLHRAKEDVIAGHQLEKDEKREQEEKEKEMAADENRKRRQRVMQARPYAEVC
jgi:hypothetical protein